MGKTGGGKSTLGNKLIDHSNVLEGDLFKVGDSLESCTTETSVCTTLLNNHYIVQVVDTPGFFATCDTLSNDTIMKNISEFIKERVPNGFNIVLLVISPRWTTEQQQTFDYLNQLFSDELSSISALVITQCDGFSQEKRAALIAEFTKACPAIAQFMRKGIHPVGFPDVAKVKPSFQRMWNEYMKSDQEHLRQLVYSCDEMKQIHNNTKDEKCSIA